MAMRLTAQIAISTHLQENSMLKKHMTACLVATAFAAAPALAQTPPPPSGSTDRPAASGTGSTAAGSSAMQPGASSGPATGSPTMSSSSPPAGSPSMAQGGMQGQFMTQLQQDHMMASRLIGTTVVSTNNESIGDVNDVIVDRSGRAMAVVIGVGGFLGIGEKDVAVPFEALEFTAGAQGSAMTSGNTGSSSTMGAGGSAAETTGSTGAAQQNTASNRATATTGNTGNSGPTGSNAAASTGDNQGGVPDRIVLRMTKAELQAAPNFRTQNDANAERSGGGSNTGSGGGAANPAGANAPRQ